MNPTDQTTLAALQELATDGVATVSVRRLAEIVGRTRETASKSLWRLLRDGKIERVTAGRGVRSGRYRVPTPPKPVQNPDNNTTPSKGVRDLFRSADLYGAGCLFEAAPKGIPLSVHQVIALGVTRSRGGVVAQLVKLESLPVPLAVSQPDPSHRQRKLWTFQELTAEAEAVNLQHLDVLGVVRYRIDQELKHLLEQERNRERLGLEPYSVVADRDILPYVIEDPETGCLVFMNQDSNGRDYGRVHPKYLGIAVHRVVWIAERGPVPAGHELHHDCGVRPCVNVAHIRALTRAQHEAVHHREVSII
jgi:DNA-binding Lrp family transcriptional regulator